MTAVAAPIQFGFIIRPLNAIGGTQVSGSTIRQPPRHPQTENQLEVIYASSIEPSEGSAASPTAHPSTLAHDVQHYHRYLPHWVDFDAGKTKP